MDGTSAEEDMVLKAWYARPDGLHLGWLDRPSRHHVRWRQPGGRWVMAKRRFSGSEALSRHLSDKPPSDLYVSTSSWLDPVDLPALRDETRAAPVLLDHLVVFDLDHGPFSRSRLETVRKRTSHLVHWLNEHTDLALIHVTFSGGKGFHVVLRDPDRTAFAEPEPRVREGQVRAQRQALLQRVLDAGHEVDSTVTADTRRIIRMPGSLHGGTRWACTVLEEGQIHRPLRTWVDGLPRAEDAVAMPKRPPKVRKAQPRTTEPRSLEEETLSLEVSTHVVGTKDRTAIVALLPVNLNDAPTRDAYLAKFPDDVAPMAVFDVGQRHLLVVPRAFPRARAIAVLEGIGQEALAARHRADEHAWTALMNAQGESMQGIQPRGWVRLDHEVGHPWSRPHLELCHRLGLPAPPSAGELAGSEEPAMRFARRR